MNYTYIVECSDHTFYTGWTNNLEKRIEKHNSGKGAKYTQSRRPVHLVYTETFDTKEQAMSREYQIKHLSREEKINLIHSGKKESGEIRQKIQEQIEKIMPFLISFRRDLHKFPEQGWLEMRTTSLVAAKLAEFGYEIKLGEEVCRSESRMGLPDPEKLEEHYEWAKSHGADLNYLPDTRYGHTGVIATLHCGPGPHVFLRFDLDALPITEEAGENHLPYRGDFLSSCQGTMHACGHDGHTTIGIGCAAVLSAMKDRLHGTVTFIFQPAEEGVRGAKSVIDAGNLANADYILAGHLAQSEDGSCYVSPGYAGTLATTKLDVVFSGRAAHASGRPEYGHNALLAASTAVLNLHAIPRNSEGSSRINVGYLQAGPGRNVICDHAFMQLEVRGETTKVNEYMMNYAVRILKAAAEMHECTVKITICGSAPVLEYSEDLAENLRNFSEKELKLSVKTAGKMGVSEDFAYMANEVIAHGGKACFTGIHVPLDAPLHSERFDFDERALAMGTCYYSGAVLHLLQR